MKNAAKRLMSLFLIALMLLAPVSANSAQTWWEGVDAAGVIVSDENCPITVEKEILTFDLQAFPADYYTSTEEFLQYSGSVTAEYSFYNPSEYTVTAKLLFPFGVLPSYATQFSGETMAGRYGVSVDGTPVEATLRHSLSGGYEQFSLERDLKRLSDDYVEGAWVRQDTPVRKYTFQVEGTGAQQGNSVLATLSLDSCTENQWLYLPDVSGYSGNDDGTVSVSSWVWDGKTVEGYVIGADFDTFPQWKFYSNGSEKDQVAGDMTEVSLEELTFRELAMSRWTEASGVSEVDWYNAMVAACEELAADGGNLIWFWRYGMDLNGYLMGWYEYEITLEPGQHVTNAVTAPVYPNIDQKYEPPVYTYTYLLSPAKTWSQFGPLDVRINTPYFMSEESIPGFSKTETGYCLTTDGLPEGELTFSLCQEEEPERVKSSGLGMIQPTIVIFVFLGLLLCAFVGIAIGNRKKKS